MSHRGQIQFLRVRNSNIFSYQFSRHSGERHIADVLSVLLFLTVCLWCPTAVFCLQTFEECPIRSECSETLLFVVCVLAAEWYVPQRTNSRAQPRPTCGPRRPGWNLLWRLRTLIATPRSGGTAAYAI